MDRTDICTNNEVTRQIDVSGRDWTGLPGLTMGAVCVCVCVRVRRCYLARLCGPWDHGLPGESVSLGQW